MLTEKAHSSGSALNCNQRTYTGQNSKEIFFAENSFFFIIFKNGANIIRKMVFPLKFIYAPWPKLWGVLENVEKSPIEVNEKTPLTSLAPPWIEGNEEWYFILVWPWLIVAQRSSK